MAYKVVYIEKEDLSKTHNHIYTESKIEEIPSLLTDFVNRGNSILEKKSVL